MALSPMPRNVFAPQHFSAAHPIPNHPLIHYFDDGGYTCHVCNTDGFGARFQCQACPVSIHVYCSDCPAELPCFFHSHSMFRVPPTHPPRNCALCREPINGLSYRCHYCDFNVHPICTQFPRELRHVIDSNHNLRLQQVQSGSCSICRNDCSSSWVYGCEICRVNIHLDCVLGPDESPPSQERSGGGTTSRGIPPPWAAGPPPFSGGRFPWNGGYSSGGAFPYGNFGLGGHSGAYGYAAPYGVPDYHFMYPNYGFVHSNVNPQTSEAVNATQPPSSSSGGKSRKSKFALVGRLTLGVMSSVIFGFPVGF